MHYTFKKNQLSELLAICLMLALRGKIDGRQVVRASSQEAS
jgi:hypothetical protein